MCFAFGNDAVGNLWGDMVESVVTLTAAEPGDANCGLILLDPPSPPPTTPSGILQAAATQGVQGNRLSEPSPRRRSAAGISSGPRDGDPARLYLAGREASHAAGVSAGTSEVLVVASRGRMSAR